MEYVILTQPVAYFNEQEVGKIRSIGVSNMTVKIWNQFVPQFDTLPSVNQIEFNPYCQRKEIREIMDKAGVALEAWGPLGQGKHYVIYRNQSLSKG